VGDVIRFPVERRQVENTQVEGPVMNMDECNGLIHVFVEVPGRCKCGENEWMSDHTIEPEGIGLHAVFDPPSAS